MTLRLRLTLFYTLLVAVVLAASGIGLYLLLRRNLYQSLDNSLVEASNLLTALTDNEDGVLTLSDEEGALQLPGDVVAILFDAEGSLSSSLGRRPQTLPPLQTGFFTWNEWRVYGERIQDGTLVLLRSHERVEDSLRQFTSSFLVLSPLAVLLAFVLGYALAGRALNPVTSLTKAAYDLAQRRAWRETLPEPRQKDELWQLAKGTNTLLETLANVIETERRFTADAAHELRTPLTVLQGRLEQALERNRDAEIAPLLRKSATALEELLTLVEKLLLLARTEAGQGLSKEIVDFNPIVLKHVELLRPMFEQRGLKLTFNTKGSNFVLGDRVALGLLVRNLLENAYKFTERGEVNVVLRREDDSIVLMVEDTGVGIPEQALPHLFERFYQADVRHRRQGSGLGLAMVESVATWHGGKVRAENRREGGARFVVTLPRSQESMLSTPPLQSKLD
jgi:two-component system, OmpR family, sensor kinase